MVSSNFGLKYFDIFMCLKYNVFKTLDTYII